MQESSPLLPHHESVEAANEGGQNLAAVSEHRNFQDVETPEESKSTLYLILLTLSIGGLQMVYAVQLSNGAPYLQSLGISKSLLALVYIAPPLSGCLVQPYIGIKSDKCRLKYGKRRPFMIGASILAVISLMFLAWTREFIAALFRVFKVSPESQTTTVATIVFAVVMVYTLNFGVNAIQAAIRAFIVDNAPTHQQDTANAWASRITSMGNIICYLIGYANLSQTFWFLGDTEFKVLCVIASVSLLSTIAISCLTISEKNPRLAGYPGKQASGIFSFFQDLYHSFRKLPKQIIRICQVQFFAWIGWFPFLFYTTTYISQIYADPIFRENPNMTPEEIDKANERGTKIGTFALMIFAITTFVSSMVLPWFVKNTYKAYGVLHHEPQLAANVSSARPSSSHTHTPLIVNESTGNQSPRILARWSNPLTRFLARRPLEIPGLTLRRAWLLSHVIFAIIIAFTFVAHDTTSATVLIACIGVPWAMTSWAPYALIAAEIRKRDAISRGLADSSSVAADLHDGDDDEDDDTDIENAGTVLGIHNIAIAAPQILATLVSSAVFRALQKPRGTPGDDSVAWILRIGGCAALIAAALTLRVSDEGKQAKNEDR